LYFIGIVDPQAERVSPGVAIGCSSELVALGAEKGCDLIVGGEKSLRRTWGFETAHDLLSSSGVSVGSLRPVVQPFVRAVVDASAKVPGGHTVAAQALSGC
jgi:hypothetical protein